MAADDPQGRPLSSWRIEKGVSLSQTELLRIRGTLGYCEQERFSLKVEAWQDILPEAYTYYSEEKLPDTTKRLSERPFFKVASKL